MSGEMLLFPRRRNPVSWQLSLGPRVRGDDATCALLECAAQTMKTYTNPVYPYTRAADLSGAPRRWPVIVAGAGPVGLTAAIDLAQRGIEVLVCDDDKTVI